MRGELLRSLQTRRPLNADLDRATITAEQKKKIWSEIERAANGVNGMGEGKVFLIK